ncbi:MAG TPA: triple tyrosine motif-containing protein, partial [Bacteroidia bacterium]|nr:triple tyrosine motif-containing protein [Bacteroidia bacterium]
TNEGLVVLDPRSGVSRNYTMRDGLPSNEFVINKHSRNPANGMLYFGSAAGPVQFNPEDFSEVQSEARPVITRLLVNYKNHLLPSDTLLVLSPDEKNITVEFTAIDFRNQDKIRYEYRLDGFDSAWHATEAANRLAVYTNLPYGQYTLQVRYKISGEPWSEKILQLPIIIETPFYAMTWFRLLVLAGIVLSTGLIVRYISQRKLRKQLEVLQVQEKIRNEKERISRDLHDNVGAQLTYVISSLDNLSFRLDKHPAAGAESERLDELSEFARGTMDQLRESIWAINSAQISLSELTGRWKQYVSQLSETNAVFSGKVERSGEDVVINPAVAIEIHRIVQEAINNAFRHSSGTLLHVTVNYSDAVLNVQVRDNGCGLPDTPDKQGHYGLQNMRQRAKLANAVLTFESGEEGTTVHLLWNNN